MQPALIVVLCVVAAITYGVLHDQITARVCVEYFTVGHDPTVFPTSDPPFLRSAGASSRRGGSG